MLNVKIMNVKFKPHKLLLENLNWIYFNDLIKIIM